MRQGLRLLGYPCEETCSLLARSLRALVLSRHSWRHQRCVAEPPSVAPGHQSAWPVPATSTPPRHCTERSPRRKLHVRLAHTTQANGQAVALRFLVDSAAAGAILGKQGSTITECEVQSGARIQLSRPNEVCACCT
jgi:hypothetical protein